jgi:hypothetical protein
VADNRIERLIPDRRRQPRGGRREGDVDGFAPLIFVVGGETRARDACEAILAKLRFAVAPFPTLDAAIAAIPGLLPELVIAPATDRQRMLGALPAGDAIPVIALPDDPAPEVVVETVRMALRRN